MHIKSNYKFYDIVDLPIVLQGSVLPMEGQDGHQYMVSCRDGTPHFSRSAMKLVPNPNQNGEFVPLFFPDMAGSCDDFINVSGQSVKDAIVILLSMKDSQ